MRKRYVFLTGLILSLCLTQAGANDSCRAAFERLPSTTNHPLTVTLKALPGHFAEKKPVTICWNFGDGRDTCIQYSPNSQGPYTVTHTYHQPREYVVCVKIIYEGGCEARKCKEIRVGEPASCKADFERLDLVANNPLTALFKAIPWHSQQKKPARICWNFGDGRDTCIEYPQNYTGAYTVRHTYNQPGEYEVCIKIIYYGGCEARKCKEVKVGQFCRADFERLPATSSNNPLLANFKAIPWHSGDKKPMRICWSFGDGRDTCINYPIGYSGDYGVRHLYRDDGIYEVCVKIIYRGGCEARKCREIRIGEACRADFERIALNSTASPLDAVFKAIPWHSEQKRPRKICWNFGDGRDTCIEYPAAYNGPYTVQHHYTQPGAYEVCVRIFYYGGCEARKCREIRIPAQAECKVRITEISPSTYSLVRGFFAATHSAPQRRIQQICWTFGDGTDTCIQATAADPEVDRGIRHEFPAPGRYRVCVRVVFEGGCVAEDCEEVVIRNNGDICGGYYTDSIFNQRSVKFRGHAIHEPGDEVLWYRWTFGDGTTGTGRQVTHVYQNPGNYEACLFIKTEDGCEVKICNRIILQGNTQSTLQLSPNPVINNLHVMFMSTHNETVTIKIYNANGVIVRNYTRPAHTGANTWDFDVANLLPGMYSVVVRSPNQMASGIFMKQ